MSKPRKHGVGVTPTMGVAARRGETPAELHARIFRQRERYKPSARAAALAREYREDFGLPEPDFGPAGLRSKQASLRRAVDVARCFLHGPGHAEERTRQAYRALERQTAAQFAMIEEEVSVEFLTRRDLVVRGIDPEGLNPYPTAEAQARDINGGRLRIATISCWPEAHHPLLDSDLGGTYDKFRAVHDFFGHAAVGTGFDRHGEWQAFLHHASMFTGAARRAATSELHLENSTLIATGEPAPHHCIVSEDDCLDPLDEAGRYKGRRWLHKINPFHRT